MTKEQARKKLKARGYSVSTTANGYIAKKGQKTYSAETLNGLCKKLF